MGIVATIVGELAVCAFLYGWLEYFVHRWDMHTAGSPRFRSHTIEHHGRRHMGTEQASLTQDNVAIAYWYTLPLTILLSLGWHWTFGIVWAIVLLWAGFAWTAVHRHIHGEKGYWYAYLLCPWLPLVRWNHLRHHANPRRGYGGMFFFLTDPFMGTL